MGIRPEDFSSGLVPVPPRSIGIECEYSIQLPRNSPLDRSEFISAKTLNRLGVRNQNTYLGSEYGSGRLYLDLLRMLEFGTAEAMGPASAAVEDIEGISRLSKIVQGTGYEHAGLYRTAGSYIPGRSSGVTEGSTAGYHENYLFPRKFSDDPLVDRLVPTALAARIWAMAGTVRNGGFVYSQKVWGIGGDPVARSLTRRTTHGDKPMAIIPPAGYDADTIGDQEYARLEVRFADPGLSLVNEFLSFSDISLSLRLLELQRLIGRDALFDLCLEDPVEGAKRYARDLTLGHTEQTLGGKAVTVLDAQESLLDKFEALDAHDSVQLPSDERLAIVGIRGLVDALRRSKPEMAEYARTAQARIGFAPRHQFVGKGRVATEVHAGSRPVMQRNLEWDRVLPVGPGMAYWAKVSGADKLAAEVRALAASAGLTPRAERRAAIIDGDGSGSTVVAWSGYADGLGQVRPFGRVYGD